MNSKPPLVTSPGPPAAIGRFQVRARLGAGAFGTVYRAYDPQLEREVALKVPQAAALDSPKAVERFLREARAAARLQHPHIVPIYDAGRSDGQYYIASAFIEGQTLADTIDQGKLDLRHGVRIVHDLAEGLAYAHRLGIVHRDVKPANVLIDGEGEAHLMDFGLAHGFHESEKLTRDGAVLGTPAYMAPEQAQGQSGDPLPASDQYSLGVILYELLTGQTPFSGPPQIVLFNVVHQAPPPPRKLAPKVSRDLETICLKALSKRPEDRYPSCRELADDLRRWLEGEPVHARRLGLGERLIRWCRREPVLALAGLGAVACLVLAAVVTTASVIRFADLARREQAARLAADEQQRNETVAREDAERKEQAAKEARALMEKLNADTEEAIQKQKRAKLAAELARKEAEAKEEGHQQALDELQRQRREEELQRQRDEELKKKLQEAERARAGLPLWTVTLPHNPDYQVALHPNGKQFAVGIGRLPSLWSPGSDRLTSFPEVHQNRVSFVAYSPDGRTLASAGHDRTVRLWEVQSQEQLKSLQKHTETVWAVAFRPDGKQLATVGGDEIVRVWDLATFEEVLQFKDHRNAIAAVAYSPDGRRLASGEGLGAVRVWDLSGGRTLHALTTPRGLTGLAFSPDGKRLMTAGPVVKVWDLESGKEAYTLAEQTCAAFTPDGRFVVTGGKTGVTVWDAPTGKRLHPFGKHPKGVDGLAFSGDGLLLLTVGEVRIVRIWDASTLDKPPAEAEPGPAK